MNRITAIVGSFVIGNLFCGIAAYYSVAAYYGWNPATARPRIGGLPIPYPAGHLLILAIAFALVGIAFAAPFWVLLFRRSAARTLDASNGRQKTTTQANSGTIEEGPESFGAGWGKMSLPVKATIGIVDRSDAREIGLSAMQLDNIGFSGKYNAVVVSFLDKRTRAHLYNAAGMYAREGAEVRISSALAEYLGCRLAEQIQIEALAVGDQRQ
jgi:hypothetical protein